MAEVALLSCRERLPASGQESLHPPTRPFGGWGWGEGVHLFCLLAPVPVSLTLPSHFLTNLPPLGDVFVCLSVCLFVFLLLFFFFKFNFIYLLTYLYPLNHNLSKRLLVFGIPYPPPLPPARPLYSLSVRSLLFVIFWIRV